MKWICREHGLEFEKLEDLEQHEANGHKFHICAFLGCGNAAVASRSVVFASIANPVMVWLCASCDRLLTSGGAQQFSIK